MKTFSPIFLLLCFLLSQVALAQTNFDKGYEKGWAEGYCYDRGISCIAPNSPIAPLPSVYESSSSFKDGYLRGLQHGQAEPKKSSYSGRKPTDFGEYHQPVDIAMINRVLSAKENSLSSSRSYRTADSKVSKRAFVARKVNPKTKKEIKILKKRNKNLLKASKKIERQVRKKSIVDLNTLSDGWYKIYIETTTVHKGKKEDILQERYIQIHDGQPVLYLGNNNLSFRLKDAYKVSGRYWLTMMLPDDQTEGSFFSIYDNEPLKNVPQINIPKAVMFYTNDYNGGGDITVIINKEPDFPEVIIRQRSNGKPSCKNGKKVFLPSGNYSYYAYNEYAYWEGAINVSASCNILNLTMK